MTEPTQIIDPPVSPYSSPDQLQAWLDELHQMELTPDVQYALDEAQEWLDYASRHQN